MSAMRQLEQTLMECPINDLAVIFSRRLMMGLENNKINDAVLHEIQRQAKNEIGNRLVGSSYKDIFGHEPGDMCCAYEGF